MDSVTVQQLKLADLNSQPESVSRVLKKFLRGDWELGEDSEDFLMDKVLLEFPVFALNDDYLRALTNIVFMKLESAQNVINQKNGIIQAMVEERDKKMRVRSLGLIKSKIAEERNKSPEMRSSQIALSAKREAARSKKEHIDTWIAR